MRAKFVYESIKHLKPRSEEEIKSYLKNLSPKEKLETGAEEGLLWLVKDALSEGADVHAEDDWALRLASENGHLEVVKVLLDAGADVHAYNDDALRYASWNGHLEVVKVLLDAGADVHARNDEALRYASSNGHLEVVKVLLDAGADVHAWNDEALRYASSKGHVEVVKLLKQYGARKKKVNESIKHLKPRSEEELRLYIEKYKDWKPDGYLTLTNSSCIEVKIVEGGDSIEYRFNYGDNKFHFPIEEFLEWGYDEDDIEAGDEKPDLKPYFLVGETKYFLDNFMRCNY